MDSIIREFDIVRGQNRLSRMLKLYKGLTIIILYKNNIKNIHEKVLFP